MAIPGREQEGRPGLAGEPLGSEPHSANSGWGLGSLRGLLSAWQKASQLASAECAPAQGRPRPLAGPGCVGCEAQGPQQLTAMAVGSRSLPSLFARLAYSRLAGVPAARSSCAPRACLTNVVAVCNKKHLPGPAKRDEDCRAGS